MDEMKNTKTKDDKMKNSKILEFATDLAKRFYEIGVWNIDDVEIRTSEITIFLDLLMRLEEAKEYEYEEEFAKYHRYPKGWRKSKKKLENESAKAVIFCEGKLWEMLYYYEAYGSTEQKTKMVYQAFVETVAKHGLWYEWGSGNIFLYAES